MRHYRWNKQQGLTLVEVLAVITLLGILLAFLFPAVGRALDYARKASVANNMRQIALAYFSLSETEDLQEFSRARTANEWAAILAEKTGLSDATLYFFPQDYCVRRLEQKLPKVIGMKTPHGYRVDEKFTHCPLFLTIIKNIDPQAPRATTPFAYTRGLDPKSGQWQVASGDRGGVWGNTGGFILYLDGHVIYYTDLQEKLVEYGSVNNTSDIRRALNPGAQAIDWKGTVW